MNKTLFLVFHKDILILKIIEKVGKTWRKVIHSSWNSYSFDICLLMYAFWIHKNSVIFNRGGADASEVFALVQVNVWSWISVKSRSTWFSYSNWCLEPLVCMRMVSWNFFLTSLIGVGLLVVSLVVFVRSWFCVFCIRVEPSLKWFPFIYFLLLIKKNIPSVIAPNRYLRLSLEQELEVEQG